jgi:cytochrome c-type biogenesis protein CcmH/NrfG
MTSRVLIRQRLLIGQDSISRCHRGTYAFPPLLAQCVVLGFLLLSAAAWPREAASPSKDQAAAAKLKRASARCHAQADLDACYDAIRWNPGDPELLVALGDALERAQRPADAIRNYRRAAALAPDTRSLAAKISAAEALAKRGTRANGVSGKHYSNAAPETQSH